VIEISVVDSDDGLESLRRDWERLLEGNPGGTIFSTWEWATAWWRSYGGGKSLWTLKILRDGYVIGLVPLYLATVRRFGTLNYRALRFIGDGSSDSDYLGLINAPGEEESVARSVVNHLVNHRSRWDMWLLNEVPETSASLKFLRECFDERNCYWSETRSSSCYVDLPPDWNAYLLQLRPRMRTKIRSLARELEKEFKVQLSMCCDIIEVESKLESLFHLHSQRWRTKGEVGVFVSAAKRRFYREISRLSLNRGWLRFYTLTANGVDVAHQYCFEFRKKMFLLQEGFDPSWNKYGVGNVLRSYVIRDCIERKVSAYDFLGGVTSHKLSWGAVVKTSVNGLALLPMFKNKLFLSVPKAIEMGKNGIRAVLPQDFLRWRESRQRKDALRRIADSAGDS
jgi:CelD/BcsL family acetyltransferase involved in cellulose biosynthesis